MMPLPLNLSPESESAAQAGAPSGTCPGGGWDGPPPGPLWGLDLSDRGRAVIRADRATLELALEEDLSLSQFLSVVSNEALRARGLDCQSFDARLAARPKRRARLSRVLGWLQTWGGDAVGAASLFLILFMLLFLGGLYQ